MRIGSFSDEVVRLGRRPGAELLWAEIQLSTALVAHELGLALGDPVHVLRRLRRADDEAIAIETTYFPSGLTPGLLDQPLDGSLWAILRREHGIVPTRASATLEVVVLDDVAARQLGVRSAAPAFLLTRRTLDQDGRCFEFARDLYRADRVEFQIDTPIPRRRT
jgi:GntR family transcriptional regulator